jgi:hypothetical protein
MMPFGRAREGELGLNDPHQAERGGSSPRSGPHLPREQRRGASVLRFFMASRLWRSSRHLGEGDLGRAGEGGHAYDSADTGKLPEAFTGD